MENLDKMLMNDNEQVNDLCSCPGKRLTLSRRVLVENHEDWCWFVEYVKDKTVKHGTP